MNPTATRGFFHAPLRFAMELLRANWRDGAGRFEPMEEGENKPAFEAIKTTNWSHVNTNTPPSSSPAPARTVPTRDVPLGQGPCHPRRPALQNRSGALHHRLRRLRPPQPDALREALEMKKALIAEYAIPAHAILIEPHARHTTTNLRNAARLLYRYGFPARQPPSSPPIKAKGCIELPSPSVANPTRLPAL